MVYIQIKTLQLEESSMLLLIIIRVSFVYFLINLSAWQVRLGIHLYKVSDVILREQYCEMMNYCQLN